MTRRSKLLALMVCAVFGAQVSSASEPLLVDLPAHAQETGQMSDPPGRYGVAAGVWNGRDVPFVEMNGTRLRQSYRLPNSPGAMADLLSELSESLAEQGVEIVLSCVDRTCGGFDFRHRLDVLPLPGMYVDLGRFRYVSGARESEDELQDLLVSVLASASGELVYLQVDLISPLTLAEEVAADETAPLPAVPSSPPLGGVSSSAASPDAQSDNDGAEPTGRGLDPSGASSLPQDPAEAFAAHGHMVLEDLSFAVGSSELSNTDFPSLAALADYVAATPDARIVLVGHTDTTGTLAANISVSRARARAVAERLIGRYGVARSKLQVEGAGYLAPRADNRTEAGRALNRRVTAVLLPPS